MPILPVGPPDDGAQEAPKYVGDCVSIVFTFQYTYGWSDKLNFCIMHHTHNIKIISNVRYTCFLCWLYKSQSSNGTAVHYQTYHHE